MSAPGWKRLLAGAAWSRGEGTYPIAAYSEFLPPPRLGRRPYGSLDRHLFSGDDPWGWQVTEYEEFIELQPGMEAIARQIIDALVHLAEGRPAEGISKSILQGNRYWPPELAEKAGGLQHERYVTLTPLALSRTQDDQGRVRWTFFGGSEQGPGRAFWRSFFAAPGVEVSEEEGIGFIRRLLHAAYGVPKEKPADLRDAGFRILPQGEAATLPFGGEGPLPAWTAPFLWDGNRSPGPVNYLLTFRPFEVLPAPVRRAYCAGKLHLLPFPGSLLFWGVESYIRLQREFPMALQIPLLHLVARHGGPHALRVPQSGWLHGSGNVHADGEEHHGPFRETYKRTHRWIRVHRYDDEVLLTKIAQKLVHVLFSNLPADVGLYDKPMARNVQIWTRDHRLLLDGPRASREGIDRAFHAVTEGGLFGYRFQFPPMRVGTREIYWHRPLVAYRSRETGNPAVLPGAPLGYLTAYRAEKPDLSRPIELWPRLLRRELHLAAVELFRHSTDGHPYQAVLNVRKLLDAVSLFGWGALPETYARQLLTAAKEETLEGWLQALPKKASDSRRGLWLSNRLRREIEPRAGSVAPHAMVRHPESLTFQRTARRSFEVAYWDTIARLAAGRFINKDNADCVKDPATTSLLKHHHRDLEALGDFLLAYYKRVLSARGLAGKAVVGDLPFRWSTDFDFSWSDGWRKNQEGRPCERDIVCVVPGRDRRRAVIMADHYDTAYMEDFYEKNRGGRGARISAPGADDNHSATAALMLAAPIFCELSRTGRLGCDVWLVHLTGEEFPSDSLGARHLCQRLVEGALRIRMPDGRHRDLSAVRIQGVYVLDMVAHNNDRDRNTFQIAPGMGRSAAFLALQAHLATEAWNASVAAWNRRVSRRGCGPGRRSPDGAGIPKIALHPRLHGEIRPHYDPRSTLYNTDGQIFSDAGVPVVLFMENYDIDRTGYHDSKDTMANIDLDYGAALVAIAIESVARAAVMKPLRAG